MWLRALRVSVILAALLVRKLKRLFVMLLGIVLLFAAVYLMLLSPTGRSSFAMCSQSAGIDRYALYERGVHASALGASAAAVPRTARKYCVGTITTYKSMFAFAQGEETQSDCFPAMAQAEKRFAALTRQQESQEKACANKSVSPGWNQDKALVYSLSQKAYAYLRSVL